MQRLAMARQAFESLSPPLHNALDDATSDRVETWLRRDVCPVVAEISANHSFRRHALWSVEHLSPGARTGERRLVETVDRALADLAKRLIQLYESLNSPNRQLGSDLVIDEKDLETLRLIANRPWFDLVCPEEYFHATRGLHFLTSSPAHTAAFDRHADLRLPLGDYVARGMFARIDYWTRILEPLTIRVVTRPPGDVTEDQHAENVFAGKFALEKSVAALREASHRDSSAPMREACTALTLVYAAYDALPQLDWLRFPPGWPEAMAPMIRACIRRPGVQNIAEPRPEGALPIVEAQSGSLCDPDTVRQIARALEDIVALYELPEDPDDVVVWALNFGRLVVVDRSPRQVFWDETPIAGGAWDKNEVQWNLLWTLAAHPQEIVDQGMLLRPLGQEMKSRRNRLSYLLRDCPELDQQIVNTRGQGYHLNLDATDIVLLQDDGSGRLEIVNAAQRRPH